MVDERRFQYHPIVHYDGFYAIMYGHKTLEEAKSTRSVKEYRVMFEHPLPKKQKGHRFALHCQGICGLNLHRPHMTCINCYIRRMVKGELPHHIEVDVLVLNIPKGMKWWKKKLLKYSMSIISILGW